MNPLIIRLIFGLLFKILVQGSLKIHTFARIYPYCLVLWAGIALDAGSEA